MDSKFVKGSAIVGIGNVTSRVLGLIFFVIVARMCSPADYGFIRYAITIAMIASVVTTSGYPSAFTRYLGKYGKNGDSRNLYFSNTFIAMTLLFLATIFVLFIIDKLDLGIFLIIVGFVTHAIYYGLIRGLILYRRIAMLNISTNILKISLVLFLFYIVKGCSPLVILTIFGLSCLIPISLMAIFRPLHVKFKKNLLSKDILKELSMFAVAIIVASVAYSITIGTDIILIEHFLDMKSVGIYSVTKTLTVIFTFVPVAITTILMPKIAGIREKEKITRHLKFSLVLVIFASVILLIGIYAFGEKMIELIFTAEYLDAVPILYTYSIGMVFYSIYTVISAIWTGVGKPAISTAILSIGAIFNVCGNIYAIPRWGMYGAATTFTLTYLIALISLVIITLFKHEWIFRIAKNE